MIRINRIIPAIFAAGALSLAVPALAADQSYPRVVGTGENATIEYGPAGSQNIVGGGPVTVQNFSNGEVRLSYPNDSFVQQGRSGVRAVSGTGENNGSRWIPVGSNVTRSINQG